MSAWSCVCTSAPRLLRREPVPASLDVYAAQVVLGADQHVYPGPDGEPGAPWFADLTGTSPQVSR